MNRKNMLIAAALSVTALGGVAVTAQAMHKGPMRADTNGDGVVSRAEFFTAAETRFKARDANNDRVLADTELQDRRGRFARLDANNDGKLSFAEQATGTAARFARLDADRDGKLTPEEMGPRGGHGRRGGLGRFAGGPGFGAMAMERLDTDNDGRITRAEMHAQADQRFDRLDVNKDGAVDRTELATMRGPGRRGPGGPGRDAPPPPPAAADGA